MVNISSNLILCNVTVHVIDLIVNLGITRKCGDNIKRVLREQVVNTTNVCCLEPCSVTRIYIYIYIYIYINNGESLICLIMGSIY